MQLNKKQLIKIIVPSLGVLVAAIVIMIVVAIVQGWDIIGWMTSSQALLIYALLVLFAVSLPMIILIFKDKKGKQ